MQILNHLTNKSATLVCRWKPVCIFLVNSSSFTLSNMIRNVLLLDNVDPSAKGILEKCGIQATLQRDKLSKEELVKTLQVNCCFVKKLVFAVLCLFDFNLKGGVEIIHTYFQCQKVM